MGKELHIVNNVSFGRMMKRFVCNGIHDGKERYVVVFPINFTMDYLPEDGSREEIIKAVCSRYMFKADFGGWVSYGFPECAKSKNFLEYVLSFLEHDFVQYDKIYLWHAHDSASILSMYYLSTVINAEHLYEVDLVNFDPFINKGKHGFDSYCFSDEEFSSRCHTYEKVSVEITDLKRAYFLNRWHKLRKDGFPIRVFNKKGVVVGKNLTFLDSYIKKEISTGKEYRLFDIMDIVGKRQPFIEFDSFLFTDYVHERIFHLFWNRDIELKVCKRNNQETEI